MNASADFNLSALMEREGIAAVNRKRALPADGWFFEVRLIDQVFPGYGPTVGAALENAKARNAQRIAA